MTEAQLLEGLDRRLTRHQAHVYGWRDALWRPDAAQAAEDDAKRGRGNGSKIPATGTKRAYAALAE